MHGVGSLTIDGWVAMLPAKLSRALIPQVGRLESRASTTEGSARVEVSPRELSSLAAILRSTRRMILPERVLGRPAAPRRIAGLGPDSGAGSRLGLNGGAGLVAGAGLDAVAGARPLGQGAHRERPRLLAAATMRACRHASDLRQRTWCGEGSMQAWQRQILASPPPPAGRV